MRLMRKAAILGMSALLTCSMFISRDTVSAQSGTKTYMPIVWREYPAPPSVFGIGVNNVDAIDKLVDVGTSWVRLPGINWRDLEPTEGARNWTNANVAKVDSDIKALSAKGIKVILILQRAPTWAQRIPNSSCGPIKPEKYAAMGKVIEDIVTRYSAAPYNLEYFEFWNEPDAPYPGDPSADGFGCWASAADPYFNGREYGQALKVAYESAKRANPKMQVLFGGLLLGSAAAPEGRFLEGALLTAGGAFDGLSFHAYDNIIDGAGNFTVGQYGWTGYNTTHTNGPALIAKARYVRNVLQRAGITGKYLMNTEVAVLKFGASLNPNGTFVQPTRELTKIYYVTQAYAAAIGEGLVANIWYDFGGWWGSNLENSDARISFKVARQKLGSASVIGPITSADVGGAANVLGYKFRANGKELWVVWTHDGVERNATFTRTPSAVTDPLGADLATTGVKISVKPIYITF
jgi:hypothetical protein